MADLHPLELKVLDALRKEKREMTAEELSKAAGLETVAATKAAFWLSSRGLCEIKETSENVFALTSRGNEVAKNGLPEKNILHAVAAGALSLPELGELFGREELNAALGRLRPTGLAEISKSAVSITPTGEKWLREKSGIEFALEAVGGGGIPKPDVQHELLERGFAEKAVRKNMLVGLTDAGRTSDIAPSGAGQLTPAMLESGEWRKAGFRFRDYAADSPSEALYPARPHPMRLIIEKVGRAFLNMGFTEGAGPWIESSFWCFDALFQPQDHPARDMADTFYMKLPGRLPLPEDGLVARVKGAHEHGISGSSGWQYKWSREAAERAVLRTHTTSVSARSLYGAKPPMKVFSIGKAFRNETLDYKHLSELHQVEGIVFDRNANFTHLLGYLREFFSFLGFDKIRFRPAYFPYTELSVEPEVFLKDKGEWLELGGAGIFRPEVVVPLTGIDCPVLAWGLGLDRLAMMRLGLHDIRDLYRNDLGWLRAGGGTRK